MDLQRMENPEAEALPGHAKLMLSPSRQQLIGVTKDKVLRRSLEKVIRAIGRISFDPDLVAAIEEYRQAAAGGSRGLQSTPDAQRLRNSLIRSIAARLKLLGLSEAQIAELPGLTGPPTELLTGPKGGRVWVFADIFPSDLALVKTGHVLEARTSALPGRVFRGVVKAVDRVVSPTTRTALARALVQNPEGLLKPDMYLDVRIKVPLGVRLSVPTDAVLETGERQLAFVVHEDGAIEPRAVTLGRRGEDHVGIQAGLLEGETVITSANFLIDSESRLRSAVAAFGARQ
jgi:Cu(I)/Ag(I) efflux system membrane fusion protein